MISTLPDEIILHVAEAITYKPHLFDFALVNHRILSIALPVAFRQLEFYDSALAKCEKLIGSPKLHPWVRELSVEVGFRSWSVAVDLIQKLPNLTSLEYSSLSSLDNGALDTVVWIIFGLSRLRSLNVNVFGDLFSPTDLVCHLQLERLTFNANSTQLGTRVLKPMLEPSSCHRLQELNVIAAAPINLNQLLARHMYFPALTHVTLIHFEVSRGWLAELSLQCPALRYLCVAALSELTCLDESGSAALPHLSKLILTAPSLCPQDMVWENLPALEELNFTYGDHRIQRSEIVHILRGLNSRPPLGLAKVDISLQWTGDDALQQKDILSIVNAMSNLRQLSLTACRIRSDVIINLPLDTEVDAFKCWDCSLAQAILAITRLKKLERLAWDIPSVLDREDPFPGLTSQDEDDDDSDDTDYTSGSDFDDAGGPALSDQPEDVDPDPELDQQPSTNSDADGLIAMETDSTDDPPPFLVPFTKQFENLEANAWAARNLGRFREATHALACGCPALKIVVWGLSTDGWHGGYWTWSIRRGTGLAADEQGRMRSVSVLEVVPLSFGNRRTLEEWPL